MSHVQITTATPRIDYTVGGTPQAAFVIPYGYFDASDLEVFVGGVLKGLTTDYTVAGSAVDGGFQGGTVTLNATVTNTTVSIVRATPIARTEDFPYPSPTLNIEALNTSLDRIAAWAQQLFANAGRNLRQSDGDPTEIAAMPVVSVRASSYLAFDVSGDPIASPGASAGTPISAAMVPVVEAATLAAARTAMGITSPTIPGFIFGLTLSNDGGAPNTKINIAAGSCSDDGGTIVVPFLAGSVDFTTNGVNGLDSGALANNTWYHLFAIAKAGGALPAYFASTSLTPTLPATYTLKRRLGSVRTNGAAHILGFVQIGDEFLWKATTNEITNAAVPGGATAYAVSVPPGVITKYLCMAELLPNGPIGVSVALFSPNGAALATGLWAAGAGTAAEGQFATLTDTTQHIQALGAGGQGGDVFSVTSLGYTDTRGRFA